MSAAPDSINYKFGFSSYAMTHNEIDTPEELFEKVWEDLSERRRQRACARCGWFVSCKIQEVVKYHRYKILPFWELKPNTLSKLDKGDICTPCGAELVGGILGTSSKRTQHLSNREPMNRRLRVVNCLINARIRLNREYVRLCHRIERIKNSRIDIENPQQQIEETAKKAEDRKKWVGMIEKKIDELVAVRNLK